MENINWEFLVQIGILGCLVILVFRSFIMNIDIFHAHFDEIHEDQKKHSEFLANLPTVIDMKKIIK